MPRVAMFVVATLMFQAAIYAAPTTSSRKASVLDKDITKLLNSIEKKLNQQRVSGEGRFQAAGRRSPDFIRLSTGTRQSDSVVTNNERAFKPEAASFDRSDSYDNDPLDSTQESTTEEPSPIAGPACPPCNPASSDSNNNGDNDCSPLEEDVNGIFGLKNTPGGNVLCILENRAVPFLYNELKKLLSKL